MDMLRVAFEFVDRDDPLPNPIKTSSLILLREQILNTVRMYRSNRVVTAAATSLDIVGSMLPRVSNLDVHFTKPLAQL